MRIFVAGATGVIGRALVPLLMNEHHAVAGMTRSPSKAADLRAAGVTAVVCDVYDMEALRGAVASFAPEVVVHQLTDLPDDPGRITELGAANSRMRREGTRNLLAAADAAGVRRLVAQSVAWQLPGDAGAAVEQHERAVLSFGGVIVRYGQFYGPGTYHETDAPAPPRIEIMQAARRTLPALNAPPGSVLEIVEGG